MSTILCEGPRCNAGRSATDREHFDARSMSEEQRSDMTRFLRGSTSRDLTYTPHNRVGVGQHGTALFACAVCGFERVYGNTFWGA